MIEEWDLYMKIMRTVRKLHPIRVEVESLQPDILKFYNTYTARNRDSQSHYLHFLRDHLASQLQMVYNKWGVGLGFFSTQASEHGNKLAKEALRFTAGFSKRPEMNWFDMHMRDRIVHLLYFPETVRAVKKIVDTCSACLEVGHRRNNKTMCSKYNRRGDPSNTSGDQQVIEGEEAPGRSTVQPTT